VLAAVLADGQFKWFYWVGPLLMLGFLGLIVQASWCYIKKVLIPKHRGRRVE